MSIFFSSDFTNSGEIVLSWIIKWCLGFICCFLHLSLQTLSFSISCKTVSNVVLWTMGANSKLTLAYLKFRIFVITPFRNMNNFQSWVLAALKRRTWTNIQLLKILKAMTEERWFGVSPNKNTFQPLYLHLNMPLKTLQSLKDFWVIPILQMDKKNLPQILDSCNPSIAKIVSSGD